MNQIHIMPKAVILFSFVLFLSSNSLSAQTTADLIAYYSFDNDQGVIIDETGNNANNGFTNITTYDCGVRGQAIRFNGVDDTIHIEGSQVIETFGTEDFTLSFYFKSFNSQQAQTQTIFSKRDDCSNQNAFAIRYTPSTGFLNLIFTEDNTLSASISKALSDNHCWHHIIVMRKNKEVFLYADGFLIGSVQTQSRVDITNDSQPLRIGASSCSITDGPFEGLLDEIRIYQRALSDKELEELYYRPDQISNGFISVEVPKDTTIYLGNNVNIFLTQTCANLFTWTPADGVNNTQIPEPVLEPTQSTTYYLEITDLFGCTATDSIRINVVDPSSLECSAFLPNAFTPNYDGLNDFFGIDNPYALPDFIALEIFDRWGNRLFFTSDPFLKWDGTFRGVEVNPGVYLYKVNYRCGTEEKQQIGQVTLLK